MWKSIRKKLSFLKNGYKLENGSEHLSNDVGTQRLWYILIRIYLSKSLLWSSCPNCLQKSGVDAILTMLNLSLLPGGRSLLSFGPALDSCPFGHYCSYGYHLSDEWLWWLLYPPYRNHAFVPSPSSISPLHSKVSSLFSKY